jgi:hypothetical protein
MVSGTSLVRYQLMRHKGIEDYKIPLLYRDIFSTGMVDEPIFTGSARFYA